jgi:thiamine-monophosphate kinase
MTKSGATSPVLDCEDAFLRLIDAHFPSDGPGLILGRGDDAAVIDHSGPLCVSSDLFLEDVHFRRSYFAPSQIGAKALAVNLSDLAAMGAVPLGFTLCLSAPDGLSLEFWTDFFQGMATLAGRQEIVLAGGDLSRGERLGVAITVWGGHGPGGRFLRRGRGEPGDELFAIGPLGLARTGLTVLEAMGRSAIDSYPAACLAHLSPSPLNRAGIALAAMPGVRSLMDVSDGLAIDLPRFLGPKLGAKLNPEAIPVHPETAHFAASQGMDPLIFTVEGGEDYALLGCASAETVREIVRLVPEARRIGFIRAEPGVYLWDSPLPAGGFDHFRPKASGKRTRKKD